MRKKVETAPYLERDNVTKAILNTDTNALVAYRKQREVLLKADGAQKEIDNLKKDVDDIKNMLSQILNRLNK